MSITKLKWQWQGTHANDLTNVKTTPNPQTGRVITGMLTGGHTDLFVPPRSNGGSSGNSGFGF
jgi:hypothetical protein